MFIMFGYQSDFIPENTGFHPCDTLLHCQNPGDQHRAIRDRFLDDAWKPETQLISRRLADWKPFRSL